MDPHNPTMNIKKGKKRSISSSFSNWDELGQIVKQTFIKNDSCVEEVQTHQTPQAQTSTFKTLNKTSNSQTSSTDSHSLSQLHLNTPNSQSSFTSALSYFPLEEWDFTIDPMDLNFLHSSSDTNIATKDLKKNNRNYYTGNPFSSSYPKN